jgi:lysophospholipid acyltransferase (LPLAT)-like uncharacterized protein
MTSCVRLNLFLRFTMDATQNKIPLDVAGFLIWMIGEMLGRTWSFGITGRSDLDPRHGSAKGRIYCLWHSHLLVLSYLFRNTGKYAVVSESRDGQKAASVARRWGHEIISGSSTRGGVGALRSCVRTLQQGKSIVITPDGPRGPREIAKAGVARIALLSGAVIVPIAALPDSEWRLDSWDGFSIPKPFAYIDVRLREPIDPKEFTLEPEPDHAILSALQKAMRQ